MRLKKFIKLSLLCLMILGIAFSLSNIFENTASAKMTEDLLTVYGDPGSGNIAWRCGGNGQGCYTVSPNTQ
jgi:hypothetical protein